MLSQYITVFVKKKTPHSHTHTLTARTCSVFCAIKQLGLINATLMIKNVCSFVCLFYQEEGINGVNVGLALTHVLILETHHFSF